jgi:hypothetical protein
LVRFGNLVGPLAHPVLYPHYLSRKAIPKYISGRTSYFQVCLAFHPYPQLIRVFFNIQRFGPPHHFTGASPWPWIDHLVSGLLRTTIRPVQTRFRYGYTSRLNLAAQSNSLTHYAKGTRSDRKYTGASPSHIFIVLPLLVSRRFQVLFHSPHRSTFHLSLTVLVHYRLPRSI